MYRILCRTNNSHHAAIIEQSSTKSVSPTQCTAPNDDDINQHVEPAIVDSTVARGAVGKPKRLVITIAAVAKIYAQTNRLTGKQRDIIHETFAKMEKNAVPNGLIILIRLFSEYPNYKNIWPQFRAIPDSALMCAPELRKHAQVYMKGLRTIIDAMDDDTKLTASLKKISKAHIKWNIHKSHLTHMVEPVIQVVRDTNDGLMTDEIKQAWTTLYDVIANLIDIYRVIEQAEQRKK